MLTAVIGLTVIRQCRIYEVLETPVFRRDAVGVGLSDDNLALIINAIAADPMSGDLMPGTGGARKLRFAFGGKGKRGGIRTIYYYGGGDVPIFLLAIVKKGERGRSVAAREKRASTGIETPCR
jgi:hypothetical protein